MSDPSPSAGGVVTVNIHSDLLAAPVLVSKRYKSVTAYYSGTTDASGADSITIPVGNPPIGYSVQIAVSISNGAETCSTSFTPQ